MNCEIFNSNAQFLVPGSSSDYARLNDQLISILDGTDSEQGSVSERKKSNVRFNEMVERIEVLEEEDKEVPPANPFSEDSRL